MFAFVSRRLRNTALLAHDAVHDKAGCLQLCIAFRPMCLFKQGEFVIESYLLDSKCKEKRRMMEMICYMFALGTCAVNLPVAAIVADIVRELHAMST